MFKRLIPLFANPCSCLDWSFLHKGRNPLSQGYSHFCGDQHPW